MTQMSDLPKPLPEPDKFTQFYWDAAKKHQLAILKCTECNTFIHPPRAMCRACQSDSLKPEVVSGRGTIYTLTRTHYIYHPAWKDELPYVIALVELEEDPSVRIVTNIVDIPAAEVQVGMPVEVVFEDVTPEVTIPKFRPRKAG